MTESTTELRFSNELEARYAEMLPHYPAKRSILVPFLLYIQDELGYLTPEAIAEVARRLELTELEVRGVLSYYSMLRTEPAGRYHVQVCTNICCKLRGGEQILRHVRERLGIKANKGVTPDGRFSVEEVECIGACSWAPAMQVNYDFFEELTEEKTDAVLEEYRSKDKG
jgi:NADH-quinone oxidoreductase subunit E